MAFAGLVIALMAGAGLVPSPSSSSAHAASVVQPQVHRIQAYADRVDAGVDELRVDLVLKVPRGVVDPTTGELSSQNLRGLRIGYDYGDGSRRSLSYINTISGGRIGAEAWARNIDEYFTVHKVIPSGDNDYLVISIEGDLNLPDRPANNADRVVGGRLQPLNVYFALGTGAPSNSTSWITTTTISNPISVHVYEYGNGAANISGPQSQVYWDNIHQLWSGGQANWGQVLDHGLNGQPAGVLPPNSISIDILNWAFSSTQSGPSGSVSDSFWYAWVDEEGSLVRSINTAPIHITGVTPSNAYTRSTATVSKNTSTSGGPTLAYTDGQAAQGLQQTVGRDGAIDFRTAGGSGYYRLLVWPESHDPAQVTVVNGAPRLSYTASDLFDAEGRVTASADRMKWTGSTAYYRYTVKRPEAPVIEVPTDLSYTSDATRLRTSGTGRPGNTITLVMGAGSSMADPRSSSLTRIVDGDHEGVRTTDVVVGADGRWNFDYEPSSRLADGTYSLAAFQTDQQTDGYFATSDASSVVRVTVDTAAPVAPTMTCPTTALTDMTPALSGGSVEEGAVVAVHRDGRYVGDARVEGTSWYFEEGTALKNGRYAYTVRQTDRAGLSSASSSPACTVTLLGDVQVIAEVSVAAVERGLPGLASIDAGAWEAVALASQRTIALTGRDGGVLPRGQVYDLSIRSRSDSGPIVNDYRQRERLACTDANGGSLPAAVFDASTSRLDLTKNEIVAEPIRCATTFETAQVSFVSATPRGPVDDARAGWTVQAKAVNGGRVTTLTSDARGSLLLPGRYDLDVRTPSGMSMIALEQLDLGRNSCSSFANNAGSAPAGCWTRIGNADAADIVVAASRHTVFRVVAAAPADMPTLPLTGGTGAWLFTSAAAALVSIAALTAWRRRHLARRAAR